MVSKPEPERERAKEILGYFLRNPHAADSFEGIVRWRLLDEAVYRKAEETRQAIAWLVSLGYLRAFSAPGGERVFSLNPDKKDEVEGFVAPGRAGGDSE